jgi:hypothetical protein
LIENLGKDDVLILVVDACVQHFNCMGNGVAGRHHIMENFIIVIVFCCEVATPKIILDNKKLLIIVVTPEDFFLNIFAKVDVLLLGVRAHIGFEVFFLFVEFLDYHHIDYILKNF